MPVSMPAATTLVLLVVTSPAAGALIFVIPSREPLLNNGSFGVRCAVSGALRRVSSEEVGPVMTSPLAAKLELKTPTLNTVRSSSSSTDHLRGIDFLRELGREVR